MLILPAFMVISNMGRDEIDFYHYINGGSQFNGRTRIVEGERRNIPRSKGIAIPESTTHQTYIWRTKKNNLFK